MRKVGKVAAVTLMTPLTVAAIALGTGGSASAGTDLCWPHATITPSSGTVSVGSRVHVRATVKGLISTHLQISGAGLNTRVDQRIGSSTIEDDVTVSQAGKVSLSVEGNLTPCTYARGGFSVSSQPTGTKPAHQGTPGKSPQSGGHTTTPGSGPTVPSGMGPGADGGGVPTTQPLSNNPFSLPSLAPDGSGIGFRYPTPDPQIAEPAAKQVRADNTSATTPVKWGQSIAAALVLLLLSAHFGMWSRRQRLAAEARAAQTGPAGKTVRGRGPVIGRRRRRTPVTEAANAAAVASGVAGAGKVTPTSGSGATGATGTGRAERAGEKTEIRSSEMSSATGDPEAAS